MRAVVSSETANYQDIRIAEKYLTYAEPPRDPSTPVHVTCFWGAPGTGKSLKAHLEAYKLGKENVYVKRDGNRWFEGYDAHPIVILDDFRASWWPLTFMLAIMDRYPLRVEYKGGYRQFRATHVYITSVQHPQEWYDHAKGEPVQQILRRIEHIVEITSLNTPTIQLEWQRFNGPPIEIDLDHQPEQFTPPATPSHTPIINTQPPIDIPSFDDLNEQATLLPACVIEDLLK